MAGRYVPPALRRQQEQEAKAASEPDCSKVDLPKRRLEDLKISPGARPQGFQAYEIHSHYAGRDYFETTRSTLNDATERPDQLTYVMLFKQANPRWTSDQIIFAKTNIEYLPGYEKAYEAGAEKNPPVDEGESFSEAYERIQAGEHAAKGKDVRESAGNAETVAQKPNQEDPSSTSILDSTPIAVFVQLDGRSSSRTARFDFAGWHQVSRVDFLQPRSKALVRMLAQKFTLNSRGRQRDVQRDQSAWNSSFSKRWAVIELVRMAEQSAPPAIEHFDNPRPRSRSPEKCDRNGAQGPQRAGVGGSADGAENGGDGEVTAKADWWD